MPINGVYFYFAPYDGADVETKSWPSNTNRVPARANTKSMAPEKGYYSFLASLGQELQGVDTIRVAGITR